MPPGKYDNGVVLSCHITGVFDVNRNSILPANDFSAVEPLATSLIGKGVKVIIFHNHFTEATCSRYAHPLLEFKQVQYNESYNPNVFRYFVYRDFLQEQGQSVEYVFMTDATDVVMECNPFTDPFFLEHPDTLFCGDEPKPLNNEWMRDHGEYFRKQLEAYAQFEETFAQQTLLNCGIIGGRKKLIVTFIEALCAFHQKYNQHNPTAYTGDMGAFNFIARTMFNKVLLHGAPVNTVFKQYEESRQDCWFRHK